MSKKFGGFPVHHRIQVSAAGAAPQAGRRTAGKLCGIHDFVRLAVAIQIVTRNSGWPHPENTLLELAVILGLDDQGTRRRTALGSHCRKSQHQRSKNYGLNFNPRGIKHTNTLDKHFTIRILKF